LRSCAIIVSFRRFHAYVEQFLVPTLKPGDVVILDNLGSHKGKAVRKAIRASSTRFLTAAGRPQLSSPPCEWNPRGDPRKPRPVPRKSTSDTLDDAEFGAASPGEKRGKSWVNRHEPAASAFYLSSRPARSGAMASGPTTRCKRRRTVGHQGRQTWRFQFHGACYLL
jgi:hypothetical protein